jgi:hypothetical protein
MELDERRDESTDSGLAARDVLTPREQRFESFAEGDTGSIVADGDVEMPHMVT